MFDRAVVLPDHLLLEAASPRAGGAGGHGSAR